MSNFNADSRPTILFDFDGVIVDSLQLFVQAVNAACRKLGYPENFTDHDLCSIKRMSIPEIARVAGVDERHTIPFVEEIDHDLERKIHEIKLFPDMSEVIQRLACCGDLGIVSASPNRIISAVLDHNNLRSVIKDIAGGDTPGRKNERITRIIASNNSQAEDTWMIGDTVSDIIEGKIAGVKTVGVAWGWHGVKRLQKAQPDFLLHKPWDLVGLVETSFAA